MQRTAIVVGATGLVGQQLTKQLLADPRFSSVKTFTRKAVGNSHEKLKNIRIDFNDPAQWKQLVQGDVLFSALGTTLKQAGGREEQYKVDHGYQLEFARAAAANGVKTYVLVSAAMSDEKSKIFYSRMKGQLEQDVKQLSFEQIHILQPGMLDGDRKQQRTGEKIGLAVIKALNKIGLLKSLRPVHASIVATAMIHSSFLKTARIQTYKHGQIFDLADAR